MVNRKWAYRELFDSEEEAARAYDDAVWRLKPKEAKSYINFKERYTGERAPGGRLHRPRQLSSLRYIGLLAAGINVVPLLLRGLRYCLHCHEAPDVCRTW